MSYTLRSSYRSLRTVSRGRLDLVTNLEVYTFLVANYLPPRVYVQLRSGTVSFLTCTVRIDLFYEVQRLDAISWTVLR